MKNLFLAGLMATFVFGGAYASDGGIYTEEYTTKTNYTYNTNSVTYDNGASREYVAARPRTVAVAPRATCSSCAQPVRVKQYSEVIDHYQVYQPVTVYQPAGTYAERRIVATPRTCNRCGY